VSQEEIQRILTKRRSYRVSGDLKQRTVWLCAATALGVSVPRFLARAGDVYARHLAWVKLRRDDRIAQERERLRDAWRNR
jgi:hypothetical protein